MALNAEEFWDKYLNDDILSQDMFDTACEFFSKEIPEEVFEKYDVVELILELTGHNDSAKNFGRVLKFIQILKDYQTELYLDNFTYLDSLLINYYCFNNKYEEVKQSFGNFIADPLEDYDKYLEEFRRILYYDYVDIIDEALVSNFHTIDNSDELVEGVGLELAIIKFFIELDKLNNTTHFNKEDLIPVFEKYNIDFDDNLLKEIEDGVKEQLSIKEIEAYLQKDRSKAVMILNLYFFKYMQKRGMSFALSSSILKNLMRYFIENNETKNFDTFFNVEISTFYEYVLNINNYFFSDNLHDIIASIWGSVYLYDFLLEKEAISQETYDNFIETAKILKGATIRNNISDLWRSNFIHKWKKADSVPEKEFIEEEKIFNKSLHISEYDFDEAKDKISEELENIGELAEYITDTTKLPDIKSPYIYDDNPFDYELSEVIQSDEPIVKEKKIGRNEPCPCGSGKKYKKCCGK